MLTAFGFSGVAPLACLVRGSVDEEYPALLDATVPFGAFGYPQGWAEN
jgi:hypothetical protein